MSRLKERLESAVVWAFDAFDIPITVLPGRYPNVEPRDAYRPFLRPWLSDPRFVELQPRIAEYTTLSVERQFNVYQHAREALKREGSVVECGVYRGGTALLLAELCGGGAAAARLHLFDTFEGMPVSDPRYDAYEVGSFRDTSLEAVRGLLVGHDACFHPGRIPETFVDLPEEIAFAHVDVDQYESVAACIEAIHPRLVRGGVILFDDYGFPGCYGARVAVDEWLERHDERPIVYRTGQAVVQKL